jgi:hypothetical protein
MEVHFIRPRQPEGSAVQLPVALTVVQGEIPKIVFPAHAVSERI